MLANDKVLYFSSTFYSLALPFTIQEEQGSPQWVLQGVWAAHLRGHPGPGILLVQSSLQVALDRSSA